MLAIIFVRKANYMKLFISTLLMTFSLLAMGQNPWVKVSESTVIGHNTLERVTIPEQYETYQLDVQAMKGLLSKAPLMDFNLATNKAQMALPLANGTTEVFEFVESPAMSPVLAAKFPSIKSYKGMSTTNSQNKAWIDYSPQGFRAAIYTTEAIVYIDPYYDSPTGNYIVYDVHDHKIDTELMAKTCGVQAYEDDIKRDNKLQPNPQTQNNLRGSGMPVIKHTYRFALSCTGWWGSDRGNNDLATVMALFNTATNRLNSFFEPELAMKFELVDNNDELIFFLSDNPFTLSGLNAETGTHPGRQILGQNSSVLNNAIGLNSYDVGHCFTLRCTDGIGGVAALGSACQDNKATGLSCVGNSNIDFFMTSTTAHEIGHQFSAGHTWNNCPTASDQFSFGSNCEPGSGSTIMSYFGTCESAEFPEQNNLSGTQEPYYHVCSLDPIYSYANNPNGAGACGTHIEVSNSIPDVWIEQEGGFYIPISTPFELIGEASDMDGDDLLYNWEQTDNDFSVPLGSPAGNSASFRSFPPSTSKTRIFPTLDNVLSNRDNIEERLPTYSRDLSFAFIARDGNLEAGGVNWAGIEFKATDEAGPFRVTSPSQFTTIEVGQYIDVEWNVANTDGDVVDCQFVDIYFSDDGGLTFPYKILTKTANDGAANVRIPNALTDNGKIKVKGHNNIFFNINRNAIRVTEPTSPGFFVSTSEEIFEFCLPNSIETDISVDPYLGFSDSISLDIVAGLPAIANFEFSQNPIPVDGSSTLSIDMTEVVYSDNYEVVVRAVSGVDTIFRSIGIDATGIFLGDVALTTPANAQKGFSLIPDFEWTASPNVTGYTLQVATNPSFADEFMIINKNVGAATTGTDAVNLDNSTVYFWRLIMENDCLGNTPSEIFTFSSNALSCRTFTPNDLPLNIPTTGTPTVETVISVTDQGEVSDLNVDLIRGNHNDLKTLRATIVSPLGTEAVLWQGECLNTSEINAGFDSESVFPNGCPDRSGQKMQPLETLAIFNGEAIEGNWALKIEDVAAGNGGSITEFALELCSTGALFAPFIVNNEVLEVRTNKGLNISNSLLLSEDENNTATELRYTIVEAPNRGTLYRNNTPLNAGSSFSQADLNADIIVYQHEGTVEEQDMFTFIVEDGEGGWVEQTNFLINASENGMTSDNDVRVADTYFSIYPNPASDLINLNQIERSGEQLTVELFTADGSLVSRQQFVNSTILKVAAYQPGLYIINITDGTKVFSKKISIVK